MKKYFSKFFVYLLILILSGISIFPLAVDGRGYQNEQQLAEIQEAIRNQRRRWTAEHNPISDLPDEEKKRLLLSANEYKAMTTEAAKEVQNENNEILFQTNISALDWRNNNGNFVTPVKDQGNCGSCWAFGSVAGFESAILLSRNQTFSQFPIDLSEQHMVSCGGAGSCNGGNTDRSAQYMIYYGLPPESCFPYTATNNACANTCGNWQSLAQKIKQWFYVGTGSVSVENLKNSLNQNGPTESAMVVYNDFFYYRGGVYSHTNNSVAGYHAILVVGYDDFEQYFIAKNSWGTGWGESGYFKIAYSEIISSFSWATAYWAASTPPNPTPAPSSIAIASPNGGEQWDAGSSQVITWSYSNDFSDQYVSIDLLRNDSVISEIAASAPRGTNNKGSYAWNIPNSLTPGDNYKIKITSKSYAVPFDVSDSAFTLTGPPPPSITLASPNGGERWEIGSSYEIKWGYASDPGPYVKITLIQNENIISTLTSSVSKGSNNQGTYNWKIPTTLKAGDYKIKINSTANSAYSDASNANFSLVSPPPPSVTLVSPNGGEQWEAGSSHAITWSYTSNPGSYVKIQLLKNESIISTLTSSVSKGSNNQGTYNWKIPTTLSPADNYKIKVTSTSNASYTDSSDSSFALTGPPPPSVTLVSPNGGEQWEIGNSYTVSWNYTSNPGTYLRIQLLLNENLVSTIASSVLKGANNSGSYTWKIPTSLAPNENYRIKITSTSNSAYSDASNNNFTLKSPPNPLKLTFPNSGEILKVGTQQTITWEYNSSAVYYIRVDLYKGGVKSRTIGYVNPTKRSVIWSIPTTQTAGNDYKIRISTYTGPAFFDESDANFTIAK